MISPGQQRVREIATELLKLHFESSKPGSEDDLRAKLINKLSEDITVTSDFITASPIGSWRISNTYTEWIISKREIWDKLPVSEMLGKEFDFNNIKFEGSVAGPFYSYPERPLYACGRKPESIAQCIFSLVSGEIPPSYQMRFSYYFNSGMMVVAEGNHRIAGYKLAGFTNFPKDRLVIYDEDFSEDLNISILKLESLFPGHSESFLKGIDRPSTERIGFITFLCESNPELTELIRNIDRYNTSEKLYLTVINHIVKFYEELVLNAPKPNLIKKLFKNREVKRLTSDSFYTWRNKQNLSDINLELEDNT